MRILGKTAISIYSEDLNGNFYRYVVLLIKCRMGVQKVGRINKREKKREQINTAAAAVAKHGLSIKWNKNGEYLHRSLNFYIDIDSSQDFSFA